MHTWPPASAHITPHGQTTITIAGITRTKHAPNIATGRDLARHMLADWAAHLGRPLTAKVTDPDGTWTITIDHTATAHDLPAQPHKRRWWK